MLVAVDVVFLGELEVPEELGVHALHLELELGGGLAGRVPVVLPVLVVIGVVLGLGHLASTGKKREKRVSKIISLVSEKRYQNQILPLDYFFNRYPKKIIYNDLGFHSFLVHNAREVKL